jgi:sterol desaturase/sphingolipid hydroxylase (fatty acid hydroxylase superfamily)
MLGEPFASILVGVTAFLFALFLGTFLEYAVHRLMHRGKMLGKKHAEHHKDGWGQGWAGEFWDYFSGSFVVLLGGSLAAYFLLESVAAAVGYAVGCVTYVAAAAYAHQVQHERPELVFWMKRPVHYLHHKHHMWKHNFGILVDFWDRIFGTYRAEPWAPERRGLQNPLRSFVQIHWFARNLRPDEAARAKAESEKRRVAVS